MENLDKKIDLKVMMDVRNKLICKECDVFPRPDVKMMLCGSCTQLLCQNCCGIQCPLCQNESKNPKFPTFIQQPELMEVYSGFKTHPCANVKNGCLEEIPAKLDKLRSHEQNCIFQMVPCPKMNCKETLIFKYLDQHLKQTHRNAVISIYYGTETNECTLDPKIFGNYKLQAQLVNGRSYYQKGPHAIWWDGSQNWNLGMSAKKGTIHGWIAHVRRDIPFPDSTTNWEWTWKIRPNKNALDIQIVEANEGLGVKAYTGN